MDPGLPDLTGTVALVTGGGGGIGGGVAERFAAAGAAVVVHHRTSGDRAAGHAHYAASKAGVIMFARSAALEYGPAGIRVNTVSPGLVDRDGLDDDWPSGVASWRRAAPPGRLGTASEIGDACVFLASPMARWITGHDLVVDGGMSAAPAW